MADRKKEVRPLANPLIETSSKSVNTPNATALIHKILEDRGVTIQQPDKNKEEE